MKRKIADILNSDPGIEVVAIARNGKEALEAVHSLRPDVVTLDIEMPVLGGLDALGYIMSEVPTPCIMISAFTSPESQETMRALEFGAVDFITKPGGVISPDIDKLSGEIIEKVKIAAKVSVEKIKFIWAKKAEEIEAILKKPEAMSRVFTVASSTGGTQALATILPALSPDLKAGVLVVQHMPEGFTKSLAERLNWQSRISIVEAEPGMLIKPGQVIIAKGGFHMEVSGEEKDAKVILNKKPLHLGVRPSADILMQTAANTFKKKTIGVVLTGMGSDGTIGSQAIKSQGGMVLAEDETSCVVYGMPKSVADAGLVDKVVTLHDMAKEMEKLV